MSTTSLAIRTSLRKSVTRTKTKVTPQSADARRNNKVAVAPPDNGEVEVVQSRRVVLEPIKSESSINNLISGSQPPTSDGLNKPSESSRELDVESFDNKPISSLNMIRLPPLDHPPVPVNLVDQKNNMADSELDRPFDAPVKQKLGV